MLTCGFLIEFLNRDMLHIVSGEQSSVIFVCLRLNKVKTVFIRTYRVRTRSSFCEVFSVAIGFQSDREGFVLVPVSPPVRFEGGENFVFF